MILWIAFHFSLELKIFTSCTAYIDRAILTFGLNALNGRERAINSTEYVGPWDATNARHFIKYTVSKGYKIESWEFGM